MACYAQMGILVPLATIGRGQVGWLPLLSLCSKHPWLDRAMIHALSTLPTISKPKETDYRGS